MLLWTPSAGQRSPSDGVVQVCVAPEWLSEDQCMQPALDAAEDHRHEHGEQPSSCLADGQAVLQAAAWDPAVCQLRSACCECHTGKDIKGKASLTC